MRVRNILWNMLLEMHPWWHMACDTVHSEAIC
jgi:hypothetical protein